MPAARGPILAALDSGERLVTKRHWKWRVMAVAVACLMLWALLFFLHLLFDLMWVFFWIGLLGVAASAVLHLIEER